MKTGDAFTFITGDDGELLRSLKKMLGDKLQYQNVEGLTMNPSICEAMGARSHQLTRPGNHSGRKSFSSRTPSAKRPSQRSFKDADRSFWSPRAPQAA
jgi:hypothetical protein